MPLTCPSASSSSGEIMLFGVRLVVDSMRKSVSMNNLSQYEQPPPDPTTIISSSNGDEGYASADDALPNSALNRGRKRGVPWTEDEHKLFLLGLQKVGKGDWRGISRNFVKTRTPTQVASHAQKYFLRRTNINRRRRRSSLFDITTDTVPTIPNGEGLMSQRESPVDEPQQALPAETKSSNVLPLLPAYPAAINPPTKAAETKRESLLLGQGRHSDATMFNLGLDYEPVASVSLQLSLSMNQTDSLARYSSTYGEPPGFSTQIIGVA